MDIHIDKYSHKLSIRNNICYENATEILTDSVKRLKERKFKTNNLIRSAYKYSRNKITKQQDSNYIEKYKKYKKLYENELIKKGGAVKTTKDASTDIKHTKKVNDSSSSSSEASSYISISSNEDKNEKEKCKNYSNKINCEEGTAYKTYNIQYCKWDNKFNKCEEYSPYKN